MNQSSKSYSCGKERHNQALEPTAAPITARLAGGYANAPFAIGAPGRAAVAQLGR
jgi:hypothetical protein